MTKQTKQGLPDDRKFVPGQHYTFNPPIETNCITVDGRAWEIGRFAEGWCLKYDESKKAFVFQGRPVGRKREHYFLVEWGTGSVAEEIPPCFPQVVK